MVHCSAKVLACPRTLGFASRFFWLGFRVSSAFFWWCKNLERSIGETTIYCVDIVVACDILFRHAGRLLRIGRRGNVLLAKEADRTSQMRRIRKLQGMSFQSWIDRTIGIVLRDMSRSQRIARDQGLKKVVSM